MSGGRGTAEPDAEVGVDAPLLRPGAQGSEQEALTLKQRVYLLVEEPSSSTAARIISTVVAICIVGSVVAFVLETVPVLEKYATFFFALEIGFVTIFTVEYFVRLWATVPEYDTFLGFLAHPFNIIDLLAILPFYVDLIMRLTVGAPVGIDLRTLRACRLFRLFKLGRFSNQATKVALALSKSMASVLMLAFLLIFAILFFSTLIFLVERGNWDANLGCYVRAEDGACSPFQSIPEASWWAITTITTVGYGDVYPKTVFGKLIACACMIIGILAIAVPTTVLGVQFSDAYEDVTQELDLKQLKAQIPAKREMELERSIQKIQVLEARLAKNLSDLGVALLEVTAGSPLTRAAVATGFEPMAESNLKALRTTQAYLRVITG